MRRIVNRTISCLLLLFIGLTSLLFFPVALLIWLLTVGFDRRLVALHLFSSFWASLYIWVMPAWSLRTSGRYHIQNKAYVMVSNHQSLLDILVVFSLFVPFKWVSKSEIFKIPIIGWNMRLNRYIRLVRGDRASAEQMLKDSAAALARGCSVFIFPEGTRSRTGKVKDFKLGAFRLALENRVPILPVAIDGTTRALPKHSLDFHGKHAIIMKVLPEIPFEEFQNLTASELAQKVQRVISQEVERIQSGRSGQNAKE